MSNRRDFLKTMGLACAGAVCVDRWRSAAQAAPLLRNVANTSKGPNIVLLMTDDQGWGEVGYYNHPVLKTPNLDAMAANGLRFDQFYAGAPVCSPTRASVLTGRSPVRTGVPTHGHALRHQERTLPQAVKQRGYATAHFGKWHLDGFRGIGAPVLKDDPYSPGAFGFDEWLSATNYIDLNPVLGSQNGVVPYEGDSSEVIVREALKFMNAAAQEGRPFFAVIWTGSPHRPYKASAEDQALFPELDETSRKHYGEMAAFDRSVGDLRRGLREMNVAKDTLLWFCSDNGGLGRDVTPGTVGDLRGLKGAVYEGGLRVPCVIEWPASIAPRVTDCPAATMDIFPTLADLLDLPAADLLAPLDGVSLASLFEHDWPRREKPIPFLFNKQGALVDNDDKLVVTDTAAGTCELYNLKADRSETTDLAAKDPETLERLKQQFAVWMESVDASVAGKDYPEGKLVNPPPKSRSWVSDETYRPFIEEWEGKPEYNSVMWYVRRSRKKKGES